MIQTNIDSHSKQGWNDFVLYTKTGHMLQTWEFGEIRKEMGTPIVRIAVTEDENIRAVALMSIHSIPYLPYKIGYIARGPVCDIDPKVYVLKLFEELKKYSKQNNIAFIKIEPFVQTDDADWLQVINEYGFKPAPNPRFMKATSIIDLSLSEEELLAACRKNTRYYIRKSAKESIEFKEAEHIDDLKIFYDLLTETSQRQNFALSGRPLSYFENLWRNFRTESDETNLRVFFAYKDNEPIATVLNVHAGKHTYYPYGASSIKSRDTSATEGLMWHSIIEAKQANCTDYNMWGVLPTEDKNHPYWGYTFFKQGFGGTTKECIGSYDLPTKPLLYTPLILMENIRRWTLRR